jgi:predicted DNA repair protein MutK
MMRTSRRHRCLGTEPKELTDGEQFFFALFDDIATLLDDISVMSKVAAKKTASILTDDLAVNAEKVVELKADRELPAVWAVCKGSLVNKAILVPLALGLNYVSPVIVHGLLVIGGIYPCYEDIESLIQKLTPKDKRDGARKVRVLSEEEAKRYEAKEIKGAITTDFVLSAEIVVITLNVVSEATFFQQVATLSLIALLVTFGVLRLGRWYCPDRRPRPAYGQDHHPWHLRASGTGP